jgi:hypothetical protein
MATIKDDGTGDIVAVDKNGNPLIDQDGKPVLDTDTLKDDDRVLAKSATSPSTKARRTRCSPSPVATSSRLTLSLANQNDDGKDLADLQYFDGTTWQNYTAAMWSASTAAASCWCAWRSRPEQETRGRRSGDLQAGGDQHRQDPEQRRR